MEELTLKVTSPLSKGDTYIDRWGNQETVFCFYNEGRQEHYDSFVAAVSSKRSIDDLYVLGKNGHGTKMDVSPFLTGQT